MWGHCSRPRPSGHLSTTVCLFKALADLLHFTQLKHTHTQLEGRGGGAGGGEAGLLFLLMTDVPQRHESPDLRLLSSPPPLTFRLLCAERSATTTAAGKQLPVPTPHCQVEQQHFIFFFLFCLGADITSLEGNWKSGITIGKLVSRTNRPAVLGKVALFRYNGCQRPAFSRRSPCGRVSILR